jgi:hypothetical protein
MAIQWRILTQKNTQTDYKCFSRSFTISEPKDKVNYYFLGGGQISEGGPYFLGNTARGAKFPRKLARGGGFFGGVQISCDTGRELASLKRDPGKPGWHSLRKNSIRSEISPDAS